MVSESPQRNDAGWHLTQYVLAAAMIGIVLLTMYVIVSIVRLGEFGQQLYVRTDLSLTESKQLAQCLGVSLPFGVVFDLATIDRGQDFIITASAHMRREQAEAMKQGLTTVPSTSTDYSGKVLSGAPQWIGRVHDIESVYKGDYETQVTFCNAPNEDVVVFVEGCSWLGVDAACAASVFAPE